MLLILKHVLLVLFPLLIILLLIEIFVMLMLNLILVTLIMQMESINYIIPDAKTVMLLTLTDILMILILKRI